MDAHAHMVFRYADRRTDSRQRKAVQVAQDEALRIPPFDTGERCAHEGACLCSFEDFIWRVADVVGPVCETSDFFARDLSLPATEEGALLAIRDAGAYGFAMSSNYNSRPRAAEVLVEEGTYRVIRRRETYEDLVRLERED